MSFNRNILLAVASMVCIGVTDLAAQTAPAGADIVYLNSGEIIQAAPGAAEAQRTFERELNEMRAELQTEGAALDSLVADYQRQEVMLSPQAKETRQQEIVGRQQALQTRQSELETQAQQRQQELLQPILASISQVIEQIRSENGYKMVFDLSSESVVAADTTLDITQLVISRLGPATGGAQ